MSEPSRSCASCSSSPGRDRSESNTSVSEGQVELEQQTLKTRENPFEYIFPEIFSENIVAKITRTASRSLEDPEIFNTSTRTFLGFPETVPQDGPKAGRYEFRDPDFWTCGFFPGTLYALLERSIKYPQCVPAGTAVPSPAVEKLRTHLRYLCQTWTAPLHSMASRTDTHDIGFITMPALRRDWELTGNEESLAAIIQAAHSLATRYIPAAGAIRSWDCLLKKDITVTDTKDNLLVIIDSMCNLDLLFYAAAHTGDASLAGMAETHARTLLRTHLRPETNITVSENGYQGQLYSTCHVANIEPSSGDLKWRWTAQGYDNDSTWARGQAWAVLGYAQTYMWTKDTVFLDAACGVAEYFLYRLDTAPECVEIECDDCPGRTKGRHVPLWDFDAPVDPSRPLRDSSAGVIAANGLLVLSQALTGVREDGLARRYLDAAIKIVRDTLDLCLAPRARFGGDGAIFDVVDSVPGETFDAVLKHGTANNNQNARRRYADHGLVYGDYYLVEFGNRLLDMGLTCV